MFIPFKKQMDEIDSLRLEFKSTPDANLWTSLAMIDSLEDCLENSIKASTKTIATKMFDLLEKSSKTSSVAPYVIIDPGLFYHMLTRALIPLQDYRTSTTLAVSPLVSSIPVECELHKSTS